jgi:hypothetical protein
LLQRELRSRSRKSPRATAAPPPPSSKHSALALFVHTDLAERARVDACVQAALFFATADSSHVTGHTFAVDVGAAMLR